jgi:organic hydroperoxide reductase OsmC/OhrA
VWVHCDCRNSFQSKRNRRGQAQWPFQNIQWGTFSAKFATPKELSGAGGDGVNPEQLFATGYSACFLSAMKFVVSGDLPDVVTVGHSRQLFQSAGNSKSADR